MTASWVVGFLLDERAGYVVLIRKNRPEWQAGKLNGVGGKIEPGESICDAMGREFLEETGIIVSGWYHFASLEWEEGVVHFLRSFADWDTVCSGRSTTDEQVGIYQVAELAECNIIPNLLWLIPLAAHRHDSYEVIQVVETGTTLRKVGRTGDPSSGHRSSIGGNG